MHDHSAMLRLGKGEASLRPPSGESEVPGIAATGQSFLANLFQPIPI